MSEWLMTILLGVVEGVTEFLPISSTGHLLLVEHWFGVKRTELFNVGIQSGALLAVLLIYAPRLKAMVMGEMGGVGKSYLMKLGAAFFFNGGIGTDGCQDGAETSRRSESDCLDLDRGGRTDPWGGSLAEAPSGT